MAKQIFPTHIQAAIKEYKAAEKRVDQLQAIISNMREDAGVSPLQPWVPPREMRDQLAAAEQEKRHLYSKVFRLITAHERAATGP